MWNCLGTFNRYRVDYDKRHHENQPINPTISSYLLDGVSVNLARLQKL